LDDIEIRPTLKFVYAGTTVIALIVLAVWTLFVFEVYQIQIVVPAAVTLLLLWPFMHWVRIRTNLTVLAGDRLSSQTGILSRSTHTLMLSRVQDVGVEQSLSQRMFNVGTVWLETAGASSRVLLHDVDGPRRLADVILERAGAARL
jgi:uncharacterized membrane protein YdbT with pleckstrin-like domain